MPVQVRVGVALAEALAECGGECGGEKQNPRKTPGFPRVYAIIMADREGFEPSVPGKGYGGLAIHWFKPLTHLPGETLLYGPQCLVSMA